MKLAMIVLSTLLFATPAWASEVCVTVDQAASDKIAEARDVYNARNGTNLTSRQWVWEAVRIEARKLLIDKAKTDGTAAMWSDVATESAEIDADLPTGAN